MFVIVQNNHVVLGPMRWNRYRFENFLEEEHEVSTSLPNSNESDVVTVNEEFKIYPIQGTENPQHNSLIEFLHGPFWTFTETHAVSHYEVWPLPLDAAKSFFKQRAASERWRKENEGLTLSIQNTEVFVGTSVEERQKYIQTYLLKNEGDTVEWKFKDSWLTLSKADLKTIVDAIDAHVQTQFSWESAKINEINSISELTDLLAISIEENLQN